MASFVQDELNPEHSFWFVEVTVVVQFVRILKYRLTFWPHFYQTRSAWSMDQGSNENHSPVNNFVSTVTKFCVLWEGLSLPHDTKFGNCRDKIVDSRAFLSWSLIHGSSWSGLIKLGPDAVFQWYTFVWRIRFCICVDSGFQVFLSSLKSFGVSDCAVLAIYNEMCFYDKHPFSSDKRTGNGITYRNLRCHNSPVSVLT